MRAMRIEGANSLSVLWPAAVVLVAGTLVLGGGTSQALWSDALLQIAGLGVILLAVAGIARSGTAGSRRGRDVIW